RNFYSYKYDYRHEWRRLISRMSAPEGHLQDRVIRAAADLLDSPSGALWQLSPGGEAYHPTAEWNYPSDLPGVAADAPFVRFLAERAWIIDLAERAERPDRYAGVELPAWLERLPQPWLIAPIIHRDRMEAFLVL